MSISRREFIKIAGIGTVGLSLPSIVFSKNITSKQPNILFIMSDDHAEQAISCYSNKLINTPQIDRIAREGIMFKNSFVTNSICGPSRATMLTGKYSHKNGFRDNRDKFDGSQMTFIKLLKNAGYGTYIVGKWHLKSEPEGFDNWQVLVGQGEYYNPRFIENGEEKKHIGYATDIITDKTLDVLKKHNKEKPFCMLMHHKAPHRNWMPHTKYLEKFENTEFPVPETFYDDYNKRPAAAQADMRIDDMYLSFDLKLHKEFYKKETGTGGNKKWAVSVEETWQKTYDSLTPGQKEKWDAHYQKLNEEFAEKNLSGKELLNWKFQHYMKDYLRCILSVDESVGSVLDYLENTGLAENTIVVYTSDQGFYLGEHGWYDKRFMYEESLGMPLLMRYPNEIKPNQVCEEMVMNLDFAPTFLDFAGERIPEEMQGESFRTLTNGGLALDWRDAVYYHYYEYPYGWHNVMKHYGVRTKRYKLIHFYNDKDYWELYDLQNDPHEINNIYGDPEYANIQNNLTQKLQQLRIKYEDAKNE